MSGGRAPIARLALQEALRRRVFVVVAVLTVAFLVLYGLGTWQAFQEVDGELGDGPFAASSPRSSPGATLLGPDHVRDAVPRHGPRRLPHARRGPRRRRARPAAAAARAAGAAADAAAGPLRRRRDRVRRLRDRRLPVAVRDHLGARRLVAGPRRRAGARARPARWRSCARCRWPARSFLASTANGIAVFMVFGAGLVAGLLGQIGEALGSDTLDGRRHGRELGCCRSRRSTRRRSARSPPTPSASPGWRSTSARSAAPRTSGAGCGCSPLGYLAVVGAGRLRAVPRRDLSRGATCWRPPRTAGCRSAAARPARRPPGRRRPAAGSTPSTWRQLAASRTSP